MATAWYLLGDASGHGFGSGLWTGGVLDYESGDWASLHAEQTSNWKEAGNLVARVKKGVEDGVLQGAELFLFTDNMVFEGTYYKAGSTSPKLHELQLELHEVEMAGDLIIHVIHIAGTRMKETGIDGLSRGDFLEGIMAGGDPLSYLPLDQGAIEREPTVENWIRDWWGRSELTKLEPEDWFTTGQSEKPGLHGGYLWSPPPAAMAVALEMLGEAIHKRPHVTHVVVAPRLMTHLWRKQLGKDADVMFTVPVGTPFWPKSCHEPLIISILLPVVRRRNWQGPWIFRGSKLARSCQERLERGFKDAARGSPHEPTVVDRQLREVPEDVGEWSRNILREFLCSARGVSTMPEGMVRDMLSSPPGGRVQGEQEVGRGRPGGSNIGGGKRRVVRGGEKRGSSDGDPVSVRHVPRKKLRGEGPDRTRPLPTDHHPTSLAGRHVGKGTGERKRKPQGSAEHRERSKKWTHVHQPVAPVGAPASERRDRDEACRGVSAGIKEKG